MGEHLPLARNLSSLRLLGTVGDRLTETWIWYHHVIGVIAVNCGYLVANRRSYNYRYLLPIPTKRFCNSTLSWNCDVVDLEAKSRITMVAICDSTLGLGWCGQSTAIQIASAAPTGTHPKDGRMSTLPVMVPGAIKIVYFWWWVALMMWLTSQDTA